MKLLFKGLFAYLWQNHSCHPVGPSVLPLNYYTFICIFLIIFQSFYILGYAFIQETQFIFTFLVNVQTAIVPSFEEALKVIVILFRFVLLFVLEPLQLFYKFKLFALMCRFHLFFISVLFHVSLHHFWQIILRPITAFLKFLFFTFLESMIFWLLLTLPFFAFRKPFIFHR